MQDNFYLIYTMFISSPMFTTFWSNLKKKLDKKSNDIFAPPTVLTPPTMMSSARLVMLIGISSPSTRFIVHRAHHLGGVHFSPPLCRSRRHKTHDHMTCRLRSFSSRSIDCDFANRDHLSRLGPSVLSTIIWEGNLRRNKTIA